MPPLVKVCGITSPADAALAASLGADFIGLIFCPSPRQVSVEVAASIRQNVPMSTKLVGVFKDQPVEYVNQITSTCQLDLAQLHGGETPDYIGELAVPSIKVFTYERNENGGLVIRNGSVELKSLAPYTQASYFLFDKPKSSGQSSSTVDSSNVLEQRSNVLATKVLEQPSNVLAQLASELAPYRASLPPIIIAGSLTDSTVEDAVRLLNPFAVDVASAVELSPGVKSRELIRRFISKAKTPVLTGARS